MSSRCVFLGLYHALDFMCLGELFSFIIFQIFLIVVLYLFS